MIVLKIGGGKSINWKYIAEDLQMILAHEPVIIIHGASTTRDEIAKKLGIPTKTITSPTGVTSVYADEKAIDVFLMTYCGLVNKRLVATLQQHNINAVGLSGIDGKLWQAKKKQAVYSVEQGKTKLITNNLTGRVEKINTSLLTILIENNYVPVLCPPAISFENEIVNTDNDWAAAVIAGTMKARCIVSLFEAPGLLKDHEDMHSVIPSISISEIDSMLQVSQGRMKKKVLGAQKALELGVPVIYWSDGRIKQPITNALQKKGTVITT